MKYPREDGGAHILDSIVNVLAGHEAHKGQGTDCSGYIR